MDYLLIDPHLGAAGPQVAERLAESGLAVSGAPVDAPDAPVVVICPAPALPGDAQRCLAGWRRMYDPAPSVVFLAAEGPACSRACALAAGAEDLLPWPGGAEELVARVGVILNRRAEDRSLHPLTGLPGGGRLARDVEARMPDRGRLAVLAVDIRHFKAFNDRYGYARGDEVIGRLARMLRSMAEPDEIVYHIGGDDFFVLTSAPRVDALGQRIVEGFAAWAAEYYDERDAAAGYITGINRGSGETVRLPLMSLTVVGATNEAEDIRHAGQLSSVLAELKQYVKTLPGSEYLRDRRRIHDPATSLREWESLRRGGDQA